MAAIKSYTDLNQSRKLAEILPHKSADGTWEKVSICGAKVDIPEDMQYRHKEISFSFFSGIGIPSWSLAALLEEMNRNDYKIFLHNNADLTWTISFNDSERYIDIDGDDPVDACYEMILKLNEQKLL